MLSKKNLLTLSIIILFVLVGTADARRQGRLIGKVVDPEGNPIEGVTVEATSDDVPDFNEIEVTDAKGVFKLDFEVIEVVYDYRFSKAGYITLVTEQTWQKVGTDRHTFILTPGESASLDAADGMILSGEAGRAYAAAVKAFQAEDYATAETKLEEALGHDPELRQAWEALAVIELEQGDYPETVKAAETAIEKGSTDVAVYRARWEAYRQMGDDEMTVKAQEELQELGALTEEAKRIYNEGVQELRAKNKEGAFVKFQQALQADPNLEEALFAVASTGFEIGKFAEAAAAASTILDKDPQNEDALRLRYNAALQLDDEQMLMEALIGLYPVEPEVTKKGLWLLAMAAYNANDNAKSIERFEKVLVIEPNNAQAHYLLGLVFVSEQENDDAIAHLGRFVELAPDDPEAASAKEIIAYLTTTGGG
jgi:Tfp pilus assembly protein PilF